MAKDATIYNVKSSGFWNTRHKFSQVTDEGSKEVGTLKIQRKRFLITDGDWEPVSGEELAMRRDPGLLRSQFSLWTDRREWLGSSLRPNVVSREVEFSTANKPLRLLPVEGLRCGWSLYAPKSGQIMRTMSQPGSSTTKIEVFRRLDFPLVIFGFFIGQQLKLESVLPGPVPEKVKAAAAATAV